MNDEKRMEYIKKNQKLNELINGIPRHGSSFSVDLNDLKSSIDGYERRYGGFIMNPDFQRKAVWTQAQQISYIESIIRGVAGSATQITINSPVFGGAGDGKQDLGEEMLLVDGLQRLTACFAYLNNEFKIFENELGGVYKEYFDGTDFSSGRIHLDFKVYNIQKKVDLMNLYILLNAGGTNHTDDELNRVRKMIAVSEGSQLNHL